MDLWEAQDGREIMAAWRAEGGDNVKKQIRMCDQCGVWRELAYRLPAHFDRRTGDPANGP